MNEVTAFKILGSYSIWLKFQDGYEKIVNIRPLIGKGFTKDLLVESNFKRVKIDSGGDLERYNGK